MANVSFNGEKGVKAVDKFAKAQDDLRKPFQETTIYLQGRFDKTFKKGGETGHRWQRNSPATILIKKSSKPLIHNRRLQGSLTRPGARNSVVKTTKRNLRFGTSVRYGKVVNDGKEIRVTEKMRVYMAANYGIFFSSSTTMIRIPAREFMFFIKKDVTQIKKIFEAYFGKTITIIES